MKIRLFRALALALVVPACASSQVASPAGEPTSTVAAPTSTVVLTSDVEWEQLNPARGDNSPKAGTLWGDRTGPGPSGFLLRPVDGFKSPPHAHTAYYHGVVIHGTIHNAEPEAEEVYLPTSSFWTQPSGGVHITAARGSSLAYIEVADAFDVIPADKATPDGTKEVVIPAASIPWVDPPGAPASADGPKVAPLWGNPQGDQPYGSFVKLPAGFTGMIRGHGATLRAVVIQGRAEYQTPGKTDVKSMEPGSYFSSTGTSVHQVSCGADEECIIYLRVEGRFEVIGANEA